jgi:hypothetical protein
MYILEIEIPTAATDANRTKGSNRFAHHALFKKIKQDMELLCRGKKPEMPLEKFKISITRHGARALDYDNLISSFKPFIDSLVLSKIIANDSWKYIRQINTDQKISNEKKLVIKVKEVSDL